jgi:putative membrane protein
MLLRIVTAWIAAAVALMLVARVFEGDFHVSGWKAAFLAAAVIAVVNGTLGAVIKFVTFPFRLLTLGLLTLVINALLLLLSASFVDGFQVDTFTAAFFGSLLLSIISWVLTFTLRAVIPDRKERKN